MGVFDKIKNALFEVEYVEVEEPTKKEKREKKKDREEEIKEEKPIAKRVVLPGKREDKVEELQEEDLLDQDFEVRPLEEENHRSCGLRYALRTRERPVRLHGQTFSGTDHRPYAFPEPHL